MDRARCDKEPEPKYETVNVRKDKYAELCASNAALEVANKLGMASLDFAWKKLAAAESKIKELQEKYDDLLLEQIAAASR